MSVGFAVLLAFTASAATLVLELLAGRLLAPFVGVSLYTWTSIIGVVLAGISLGNWYGGRVADRHPSPRTLGTLFFLGGLSTICVLGIIALLGDGSLARPVPLLGRIFLLSTVAFFPPSFLLGMVTPVLIKLMVSDVGRTGRTVGLVYAVGTLGSLAGNFLTGFVLVAYLPIFQIVLGIAVVLLLLGLVSGRWWRPDRLPDTALPADPPPGPVLRPPSPSRLEQRQAMGRTGERMPPVAGGSAEVLSAPATEGFARLGLLHLRGNGGLASGIVVIASFCTMGIELAASRVLAPHVGVSLYSWTGIIGVVLAGIALGNYLGGRIADRWPHQPVLGLCLFLSGLASLSVLLAVDFVTQQGFLGGLGLMERIVALTAVIFFVPVLLLGTISPQVIRLAVTDLARVGRTSGRIYAWSTAGAIAGTFATGWWLISALGVNTLIFVAGLVLLALAIVAGRFWQSGLALVASLVVAAGSVYGLYSKDALRSPCTMETSYFCIKVLDQDRGGVPVKLLVLDHLVHSYVKLGDPSYLGYDHEQVQAEITRFVAARNPSPRVLVIGGGGYTYPRWVEAFVPTATVEVVEIDPGVTETAYRDLGLPRDTRIISYNMDGRQFVHEIAPRKHYDLVVQDAVNDLSVPYHIMTREYNEYIRQVLVDDGIYLLTVIDLYREGQLMRSALRTRKRRRSRPSRRCSSWRRTRRGTPAAQRCLSSPAPTGR